VGLGRAGITARPADPNAGGGALTELAGVVAGTDGVGAGGDAMVGVAGAGGRGLFAALASVGASGRSDTISTVSNPASSAGGSPGPAGVGAVAVDGVGEAVAGTDAADTDAGVLALEVIQAAMSAAARARSTARRSAPVSDALSAARRSQVTTSFQSPRSPSTSATESASATSSGSSSRASGTLGLYSAMYPTQQRSVSVGQHTRYAKRAGIALIQGHTSRNGQPVL
jgi:hypothetical protein